MKRRHYLGVTMAMRAPGGKPRPRNERDISTDEFPIIMRAPRPHDPPRRLTSAGRLVVAMLTTAAIAFSVAYALGVHFGGHAR